MSYTVEGGTVFFFLSIGGTQAQIIALIKYCDGSFFDLSFVFQLVSEKVGGAEGTKLDDDFKDMEKVIHLLIL